MLTKLESIDDRLVLVCSIWFLVVNLLGVVSLPMLILALLPLDSLSILVLSLLLIFLLNSFYWFMIASCT